MTALLGALPSWLAQGGEPDPVTPEEAERDWILLAAALSV